MPVSICENRDCMAAMAEFPDKFFDLAVVDPPYGEGCNLKGGSSHSGKNGWSGKIKKSDGWNVAPTPEYFAELRRVSKNQIVWGGNYFVLPPSQGWILWDKGQRDFSLADGEMAWTSFDRALRIFEFARALATMEGKVHPTQKPIALYKWLLTNYAKPGDKILDTHLGSGSSRIAAWDMGFDFWGYELDADYHAAHEARFKAHTAKPVLFAPEEMYNFEQAKLFDV